MTQKKPIYADEKANIIIPRSVVALAVLHRCLFSSLSACKPLMASASKIESVNADDAEEADLCR
ncbi:MAG: hypothetical protein J7M34_00800 [Anaerolineae bacterium]|nr:hypothetical protein [Anaerolineae bacterium]